MNFKRLIAPLVVGLLLALPAGAFAAEAESFVKTKQSELITLLKQSKNPKTDPKIEAVCDKILDYEVMAKDSLGDVQWNERTEAERKQFHGLLKQLVQRAYRKNLSKTLNYELSYVGEEKVKDGTLVRTVAKDLSNTREAPLSIDFKVHKAENRLKIRDIVTEGSSLTASYKNQFTRIIKKKGFDELLRRMKTRLEKDEEE
jgi:phospholipid transport system substrate-binding protein